jgi:hypothetical protein
MLFVFNWSCDYVELVVGVTSVDCGRCTIYPDIHFDRHRSSHLARRIGSLLQLLSFLFLSLFSFRILHLKSFFSSDFVCVQERVHENAGLFCGYSSCKPDFVSFSTSQFGVGLLLSYLSLLNELHRICNMKFLLFLLFFCVYLVCVCVCVCVWLCWEIDERWNIGYRGGRFSYLSRCGVSLQLKHHSPVVSRLTVFVRMWQIHPIDYLRDCICCIYWYCSFVLIDRGSYKIERVFLCLFSLLFLTFLVFFWLRIELYVFWSW